MKKIIAVLISVIFFSSMYTVSATANTQEMDSQGCKDLIIQYFKNSGEEWYENSFYDLGKFGDIEFVCVLSVVRFMDVQHNILGSYNIESLEGHRPYRLGLYVIKDSTVYTLEEAYEKGIIGDDTLDKMVKLMQNDTDNRFLYLKFTKRGEETTEPTTAAIEPTTPAPTAPTNPEPTEPATAPQAEISAKNISLKAGRTKKITVSNVTVKSWKSSDKKVATVSNGKVTALKKGNAIITATLESGEKLTTALKVTSNPKLNKTTKKLKINDKFTLKVNGKAGTTKFNSNKPKIATVTKKGVVKAKKKGTAKITVTTNGGVKLKCTVKVR